MKKLYLMAVLCLICYTSITAQRKDFFKEKKHELRLSIGSVNDNDYHNYYYGYSNSYYGGYYGGYGYYGSSFGDYNSAAYYVGPTKTFGVIGLSYFYHLPNTRFSFGTTASYNGFNTDYRNRMDDRKVGSFKEHNLAFTPSVRYAWIAKDWFQFYSGVGVSLYLNVARQNLEYDGKDYEFKDTSFKQNIQVTPLGFSVGKTLFGFGEVNLGGRAGTFVGGIGYRF